MSRQKKKKLNTLWIFYNISSRNLRINIKTIFIIKIHDTILLLLLLLLVLLLHNFCHSFLPFLSSLYGQHKWMYTYNIAKLVCNYYVCVFTFSITIVRRRCITFLKYPHFRNIFYTLPLLLAISLELYNIKCTTLQQQQEEKLKKKNYIYITGSKMKYSYKKFLSFFFFALNGKKEHAINRKFIWNMFILIKMVDIVYILNFFIFFKFFFLLIIIYTV